MIFRKRAKRGAATEAGQPPRWAKDTNVTVTHAFTAGGIDYYEVADLMQMPWQRAMAALDLLEKFSMNIDRKFMEWHVAAVKEAVNKGAIADIAVLNAQLESRLKWICAPDMAYELAAVIYFDSTESPVKFDAAYAAQKVERWKALNIEDFFLQARLKEYIPHLGNYGTDLAKYTRGARMETIAHIERIGAMLSNQELRAELNLRIQSLKADLTR